MSSNHLPASVVFCDVETTGFGHHDRIVSFGGIGMISRDLVKSRPGPAYLYLVFNPGTKNCCDAARIHGFSDSTLRLQDPFAVHASNLWRFLTSYELLVAHNAAFDLRFINRELRFSGLPALTSPVYCTMKGYRALDLGGSASLSAICRRIKLARAGHLARSKTPGSRCRSTFGCTAARFRPGRATRSLALRQICVTLRAAIIVSIMRVGRRSGMSKPGDPATLLIFITMDGRRAAQRLHPWRGRS
jgi:hypothetical protein